MSANPKDFLWNKVAAALRAARAPHPGEAAADAAPPFGFQSRVVALAREERRRRALVLWRRWTLRTACCTVAVFACALFHTLRSQPQGVLMPVPDLEYPQPPAP